MKKYMLFFLFLSISKLLLAQNPDTAIIRASTVPIIDGIIDEVWNTAPQVNILLPFKTETPSLGLPGETYWKGLWTSEGIYILVKVTDDAFLPAHGGTGNNLTYDKPELFFDVNPLLKDGKGSNANSGHFFISPSFDNEKELGMEKIGGDGVILAYRVDRPNYVAEYFIPYSKLLDKNGSEFIKTNPFGFDVRIVDRDVEEIYRMRAVWSNNLLDSYSNMDGCGTITLAGFKPVKGIAISTESDITSIEYEGGKLQMYAVLDPPDAASDVKWSVINGTGKASIDENGLVTATVNGSVTVTAITNIKPFISISKDLFISGQMVSLEDINLIKNGDFKNDGQTAPPWTFYSTYDPKSIQVVDGICTLSPSEAGPEWQVMLYQSQLKLIQDSSYILSFTAWSDAERLIGINLADPQTTFIQAGSSPDVESDNGLSIWHVLLTSEPKVYNLHVNVTNVTDTSNVTLYILTAATLDVVYLDNISLAGVNDFSKLSDFSVNVDQEDPIICGDTVKLNSTTNRINGSGAFSYKWSPSEYLNNPYIPNPLSFTKETKTYTLTVINEDPEKEGDSIKMQVKVIVNPLTVNAGDDISVVCGNPAKFNLPLTNASGATNLEYSWMPESGLDDARLNQPSCILKSTASYVVNISSSAGCFAKDSLTVNVVPLSVNAGGNTGIVCGEVLKMKYPLVNSPDISNLTYKWEPAIGLDSTNIAQPTVDINSAEEYILSIESNGCSAKDSVQIDIIPLVVNYGSDKTIVCGESFKLYHPASNSPKGLIGNILWYPETGLDNVNILEPTITIKSDKKYTVSIITESGCSAKDSFLVNVEPLSISVNDLYIGCGESSRFNPITNFDEPEILYYKWKPTFGLSDSTVANPIASPEHEMMYTLKVETTSGCSAEDNAFVHLSPISVTPSICMVTVNENNRNVIVISPQWSNGIDSFLIYRESEYQTDEYILMGTVASSGDLAFTDTLSNAKVQSNKYKLSILDKCGFKTGFSSVHKTMHLNINRGIGSDWNLIWEPYDGIPISSYRIFRGSTINDMVLIGSTSGGNTTFSDISAPSGDIYYQIEVILPSPCNTLKSGVYNYLRSNIMSNVKDAKSEIETFVYPNPAKNHFSIKAGNYSPSAMVIIYDSRGNLVINQQGTETIDISNLSNGIYLVKLIDSGRVLYNKLIKE